MINILTVSYFNVNEKNGGAIFAKNLDNFLNTTGSFNSLIYSKNGSINDANLNDIESVKSIRSVWFQNIRKIFRRLPVLDYVLRVDLNALIVVIRLYFRKNKLLRNNQLILFHEQITLFYFSLFFNADKYRIVLIMHNDGNPSDMVTSGINNTIRVKMLNLVTWVQIKRSIRKSAKVVFLCSAAQSKFQTLYGLKFDKSIVIPNGIKEISIIPEKNNLDKINFITVCALNERKGIDILLECLPHLCSEYSHNTTFTILGKGKYLNELRKYSSIYKNLNVVGETDDVLHYLNRSNVFFLLSRIEGQPLSIIEALRSGLFIFTTDVGCNSSMVGQNGLLVNPNNNEVLQGFEFIIKNWDSLKFSGELSQELFKQKFTEKIMYQSYLKLFNELT